MFLRALAIGCIVGSWFHKGGTAGYIATIIRKSYYLPYTHIVKTLIPACEVDMPCRVPLKGFTWDIIIGVYRGYLWLLYT